jgi:shikimate kinase
VKRHLILVGLPGAGKSTVASLVAERLGTHATDIDPVLERAAGMSVADVFASMGEPAFREREREAVVQALYLPPHVIAPGGGWAAEPGNLETVAGRALVIHLAVSPERAAARLDGASDRPLLAGDPLARLTELSRVRGPAYGRSDASVDANDEPPVVAERVVAVAKRSGGW